MYRAMYFDFEKKIVVSEQGLTVIDDSKPYRKIHYLKSVLEAEVPISALSILTFVPAWLVTYVVIVRIPSKRIPAE